MDGWVTIISFAISLQREPSADHPRTDRRERALLSHVAAGECVGAVEQAVPVAGLSRRATLVAQPGGQQTLRDHVVVVLAEPPVGAWPISSSSTGHGALQ